MDTETTGDGLWTFGVATRSRNRKPNELQLSGEVSKQISMPPRVRTRRRCPSRHSLKLSAMWHSVGSGRVEMQGESNTLQGIHT